MKTKPRILVTRKLPGEALSLLDAYFDVELNQEDRVLEKQEIIARIKDKDALLCLLTDTIDKSVLDAAKNLRGISNYAVGFNNIDILTASNRKIPVCITPGILTETTADLTWALILGVTRRIVEADEFLRQGQFKGWAPELLLGTDVYGKTLGIVGMGRIGQAVAKRAVGFSMNVIYYNHHPKSIPHATAVSLEALLKTADIISLHIPLTKGTEHFIGEKELQLMKNTAYLINTTRGPVVDEKALIQALQSRKIRGAGLDVYEEEPKVPQVLMALKNVILLPHIGSATQETREKMAILAVENIIALFKGERPATLANPQVF